MSVKLEEAMIYDSCGDVAQCWSVKEPGHSEPNAELPEMRKEKKKPERGGVSTGPKHALGSRPRLRHEVLRRIVSPGVQRGTTSPD